MNVYRSVWALLLFIAIVLPPQKHMGVNGFKKNWDAHIETPAKRLSPPKFIQYRYDIGKRPINIITYLSYLVDFANWLLCIAMLPCVLIFKDSLFDVVTSVFAFIYFFINLPIGIARTVCTGKIAKKQKTKLVTEQYAEMRSVAEAIVKTRSPAYRETMRETREYFEIIKPFLNEFEKCIKTKKGKLYIPEDNLKWLIDKIIPKYQKHLAYTVSSEEPSNKVLTVYCIRNNKIIEQVPIKKA